MEDPKPPETMTDTSSAAAAPQTIDEVIAERDSLRETVASLRDELVVVNGIAANFRNVIHELRNAKASE